MRAHNANELREQANILAADGSTVLASGVACGVTDIAGERQEQAQLDMPKTTHMILFRGADATLLQPSGYIQVSGVLYIMDYPIDPRVPRPGVWLEAYCHVERTN